MKRKIIAVIAAAVLAALGVFIGISSAPPRQDKTNPYVADKAGVLTAGTESELYRLNSGAGKAKFFVATAKTAGKYSLAAYARRTAKDWKLKNSDMLLVLRPGKGDFYIVGGKTGDKTVADAVSVEVIRGDPEAAALAFVNAGVTLSAEGQGSWISDIIHSAQQGIGGFLSGLFGKKDENEDDDDDEPIAVFPLVIVCIGVFIGIRVLAALIGPRARRLSRLPHRRTAAVCRL